ncbi:MAG TPA: DUF4908 domain-containing protein [Caulobacteraceae bacterium]
MVQACAVGLLATALAPLAAGAPITLRDAFTVGRLGNRPDSPVIGRYQTDDGGVFVLDRSTPKPLMKFGDDPEIWALAPSPGPRGDIIYRNDLGEEMLRATNLGGMTVFTDKRPGGSPAALDGASSPLRVSQISAASLFVHFYQASVRASRAAQHAIGFETREDAEPATAPYMADAALVASEALVDIAAHPNGRATLARIADVVIAQGPRSAASLQKGVLTVTIVPAQGVAGRPSSRKIEHAAGAR